MERKHITSTEDLKALFPELSPKSKYRKALDTIFKAGLTVTITRGGWFENFSSGKSLFGCVVETGNLEGIPKQSHTTTSGTKVFTISWPGDKPAKAILYQKAKIAGLNCTHFFNEDHINSTPDRFRNINRDKPNISRSKTNDGPWVEHTAYPAEMDDRTNASWAGLALAISKAVDRDKVRWVECGKCGGKGRLNWTSYADGICFQCGGAGGTPVIKSEKD